MGRFDTQIEAIEKGALIRPMPMLGTLTVVGPERASWVAGIVTADVRDLSAGQGAYALSVSRNGRIQSELWVVYEEERVLLGAPKPLLEGLHEAMDRYLIMEDAELAIADEPFAWWLAHGPAAADVVSAAREIGAIAVRAKLGDIDTAIVVSPERTTHNLAEVLTTVSGAVLVTPNAWERIRIERMLPRYGVDFEVDCYPQEASLESLAVSFNKGCYVGQEAVFMLEKRGHVSKRLVRLVLDEEIDLAVGAEVATPDGKGVGKITSATIGDGKTWAMGMVRYKQTLSGTELTVAGHPAKVSCLS
jgi:folate-binding protein YgfZ